MGAEARVTWVGGVIGRAGVVSLCGKFQMGVLPRRWAHHKQHKYGFCEGGFNEAASHLAVTNGRQHSVSAHPAPALRGRARQRRWRCRHGGPGRQSRTGEWKEEMP
jgi:hypothetical protein